MSTWTSPKIACTGCCLCLRNTGRHTRKRMSRRRFCFRVLRARRSRSGIVKLTLWILCGITSGAESLRLATMEQIGRADVCSSDLSATVLFSGAASQALSERNSQTHIVDFVRDYIRRGIVEAGYDGTDEPTYQHRPVLDFSNAQTAEERWLDRKSVV